MYTYVSNIHQQSHINSKLFVEQMIRPLNEESVVFFTNESRIIRYPHILKTNLQPYSFEEAKEHL